MPESPPSPTPDPTRSGKQKLPLPPCGLYVGTGVYPTSKDYLLSALYAHQTWVPQSDAPLAMIDRVIEDNQGNLVQLWSSRGYAPSTIAEWQYALDEIGVHVPPPDWEKGENLTAADCPELARHAHRDGAGLLRFLREAADRDIYTFFIYTHARPEWVGRFKEAGDYYLGYDYGERFTFRFEDDFLKGRDPDSITLSTLAADLIARVQEHVHTRKRDGWGAVIATSSNFHLDYEVLGGAEIPLVEDFAFQHLNMASALARGLYRQFDLPAWGSHLAHEHYSWIPNGSPHKFDLLRAALYQKYMAGAKIIVNESGNWFVEASLCEDSPKFDFPHVPLPPNDVSDRVRAPGCFAPYVAAARRHYAGIDYQSPIARAYRQVVSAFYDDVKANGTPAGQPETTIALVKGAGDLCGHRFNPNAAVGGAHALADRNPAWFEGPPERGWEIARRVFHPLPPVLDPYHNPFLSGAPFGLVDIVSFAQECVDADFLLRQYRALLFTGWNTASERQYETLLRYVEGGGTVFISIPQLATRATRHYGDYQIDELVRGGDFSALCGVRVTGTSPRIYWATAPQENAELDFSFPRRFGPLSICLGEITITDPTVETLAVDDEQAKAVLLRCRRGHGMVYFLNSWSYPGAWDVDAGPGSTRHSPGLVGAVFQHIAARHRGTFWITDDGQKPGVECNHIAHAFFPENGTLCLQNVDFNRPHRVFLHHRSDAPQPIVLDPGEFRRVRTPPACQT